jgi:ABC-type Fe3+/spermidine/putrescine transport system ATPase subunit
VAKDQEVKLVVRPETIRLNEDDPFFKGKINKVVYLGATVEYEIQLDKGVMFATASSPIEKGILSTGTDVNISFSLKGIHALAS